MNLLPLAVAAPALLAALAAGVVPPAVPDPPAGPAAARTAPAAGAWTAPLDPLVVVRHFALGPQPWSAGHRGVDLATVVAAEVRAPAAGRVTFAADVAGVPVVVLSHPLGLRSTFQPARVTVVPGTVVGRAETFAVVSDGAAHCPGRGATRSGTCLHWGVLRGRTYRDPLLLLRPTEPVILLPVTARSGP